MWHLGAVTCSSSITIILGTCMFIALKSLRNKATIAKVNLQCPNVLNLQICYFQNLLFNDEKGNSFMKT